MGTVLHACRDGCSEDVQSMKVHGFLLELTWGMLIVDTRIYRFVLCCCALHSTGVDIFPVRVLTCAMPSLVPTLYKPQAPKWVVVKIRVPFWVPMIIRHL